MSAYDQILSSEVSLQTGEEISTRNLIQSALGPNGTISGIYDESSFLNTVIYEFESQNGDIKEYSENIIAKNMITQVDSDGYSLTTMKGINSYKRDAAVAIPNSNMYVITNQGQKKMIQTNIGWKLLVKRADDYESWISLKDTKEGHPFNFAEFSKACNIFNKPNFL